MAAALAGIAGAAIGAGSTGSASAAQYQASKHERNIAWKRQQAWELMAPSLRVAGLRQAGLNPILAATQGVGQGATNVNMADPGSTPQFDTDTVGKVISSVKQAKAMDEQLATIRAEREQEEAAARIRKKEAEIFEEFGRSRAAADTAIQEEMVMNTIMERGLFSARTDESKASGARQMTERERIALDKEIMATGVPSAKALEEMYQKYPVLRQLREFIKPR